jgi:Zn finger protein HypA/HybF involved in hydrogenase expression
MYKVMPSGRKVIDPFYILSEDAGAGDKGHPFTSTSGLSNESDSQCPKCHSKMSEVFIDAANKTLSKNMFKSESGYQPELVYFCPNCRVTNPKMNG